MQIKENRKALQRLERQKTTHPMVESIDSFFPIGGIQKVRSPRGGALTKSEQKRTGGGGAFTIAYVRFSKNCMANFVHAGYSYRII